MSGVVKKGTTILTCKPFVFVLKSELRTTRCDNCLKRGKLLRCSVCQYVYYCNRNCQKESWPIHKAECPYLKNFLPNILPDAVRFIARVIFKLKQGGADEVEYYTEKDFMKYKDLMSHYADIITDKKRHIQFLKLYRILLEFFDFDMKFIPNSEDLMNIFGKICINNFSILDENDLIGSGLYLSASVIDHSCKPNAVAVFEGTTVIVRTLTDLPSLDWSQIRISYIDLLKSKKDRYEKLHSLYYFWCDCERCKKDEPMAEAAACPNSSCDAPCSIEANKCAKCSARISVEFKKTFQEVVDFTAHQLKEMGNTPPLDESTMSLCKMCLKKQEGVLHKFNVQYVRILETAHVTAINLMRWEDAKCYGKELLPKYLLYYGEIHPLTGLLYLSTGKIWLLLKKWKEALQALNKANMVFMITHGDKHSIVSKELRPLLYVATLESNNHGAA